MTERNEVGREGIGTHWALVRAGFYIHTLCVCVSPSSIPVVNIIMLVLFNMLLSSLLLNSQGLVPFHTWSYPVLFYTAAASSSPSPPSSSSSSHHVCGLYVHRCVHVCVQVHTPVCSCKQAKEDIRWPTLSLSALLPWDRVSHWSRAMLATNNPLDLPVSIPYSALNL